MANRNPFASPFTGGGSRSPSRNFTPAPTAPANAFTGAQTTAAPSFQSFVQSAMNTTRANAARGTGGAGSASGSGGGGNGGDGCQGRCTSQQRCVNGQCVAKQNDAGQNVCQRDAQCGSNKKCVGGVCVSRGGGGGGGLQPVCPPGQTLQNGVCRPSDGGGPPTGGCPLEGCPAGQTCQNNTCVPAGGGPPPPGGGNDPTCRIACPPGYTCVLGQGCVPTQGSSWQDPIVPGDPETPWNPSGSYDPYGFSYFDPGNTYGVGQQITGSVTGRDYNSEIEDLQAEKEKANNEERRQDLQRQIDALKQEQKAQQEADKASPFYNTPSGSQLANQNPDQYYNYIFNRQGLAPGTGSPFEQWLANEFKNVEGGWQSATGRNSELGFMDYLRTFGSSPDAFRKFMTMRFLSRTPSQQGVSTSAARYGGPSRWSVF